jgi:hypothetical protein
MKESEQIFFMNPRSLNATATKKGYNRIQNPLERTKKQIGDKGMKIKFRVCNLNTLKHFKPIPSTIN